MITLCLWGTAFYYAYVDFDLLMHFYFGLISTISVLITHCWVFFYFIGTGQGIREGVLENNLDRQAIKVSGKFKGMTFPFALFSMLFMITTSIMGGALRFQKVTPTTHMVFVYITVLFNFFSFYQEYRVIRRNQRLMAELNSQIS